MKTEDLISPAYLAEQKKLHAAPRGYGGKGDKWADAVAQLMGNYGCSTVLDYGAGQGTLATALAKRGIVVREYDPSVKRIAALPDPADLVVCTDVLEHIEPDLLKNVLAHIRSLARRAAFVVIATRPASKFLSDGRNAHLIVEGPEFWREQIERAGFTIEPVAPRSPSDKTSREWVAVLT